MKRRNLIAVAAGAVLVTVVAGGFAWATIPAGNGVIQGCYDGGGSVKVVEALPCPRGYTPFQWNQPGPPGPPGTALAYAHVNANGTIDHASSNVTVERVFDGSYCVGVTGGTVHVAVATLDAFSNVGGSVQTGFFSSSDCPETTNDVLVVTRPHLQDGGFPGSDRAFYLIVN
jgi:hypothetical protein